MSQKAIYDFPQEQVKLPLIHYAYAQYRRIEEKRIFNTTEKHCLQQQTPLYTLGYVDDQLKMSFE